ncbi:serine protease SP24D-like [Glossina fuscipes fuscipes]
MKLFIATVLTLLVLGVQAKSLDYQLQPRIVQGRNASLGQFPYIISLRYRNTHICGGSIISANYIVTAAHCVTNEVDDEVFDMETRHLSIRAGSIRPRTGGVIVQVAEFTKYPGYHGFLGDIAVVRLAEPLNFTNHISAINLTESDPPDFANVLIAGWGRLSENGPRPRILKYTPMASLSHDLCSMLNPRIDESLLCMMTNPVNPTGICNGDSGGPAVYNGRLVGVANYIRGDCGASHPDVFARIAHYADWIRENSDL